MFASANGSKPAYQVKVAPVTPPPTPPSPLFRRKQTDCAIANARSSMLQTTQASLKHVIEFRNCGLALSHIVIAISEAWNLKSLTAILRISLAPPLTATITLYHRGQHLIRQCAVPLTCPAGTLQRPSRRLLSPIPESSKKSTGRYDIEGCN